VVRPLDGVGDAVAVAVAVDVVGEPVVVAVDGRLGVGTGFDLVGDEVAVAVDVAKVGEPAAVGVDGCGRIGARLHAVRDPVAVAVGVPVVRVAPGHAGHAALDPVGDPVAVAVGVPVVGDTVPVKVGRRSGGDDGRVLVVGHAVVVEVGVAGPLRDGTG